MGQIDWGQLQALPQPRVMGTIPQNNQQSPLSQLAGGVMQGATDASNIAKNNQDIAASKQAVAASQQQMQQSAALFPDQKAVADTAAQNSVASRQFQNLDEAKQYSAQKEEAAKQGEAAYVKSLTPQDAMAYNTAKADLSVKLADANNVNATATKTNIENYQGSLMTLGGIGAAASDAYNQSIGGNKNPNQQQQQAAMQAAQQTWDLGFKQLPEGTQNVLKQEGYDKFSPPNAMAAMRLGQQALDNHIQMQKGKGDDKLSALSQAQTDLANINMKIQQGKAAGQDTSNLQKQADEQQNLIDKEAPNHGLQNFLTNKNTPAVKDYWTLDSQQSVLNDVHRQAVVGLNLLDKSGKEGLVYGPGAGALTGKFTATGQEVVKTLNTLTMETPAIYHVPATALRSTAMIDIIKSVNPSTANYPVAIKWILNYYDYLSASSAHVNWIQQNDIARMGAQANNDEKGYDLWLKQHPDPLTTARAPDFNAFYKVVPEAKSIGLEKDVTTVQQGMADYLQASKSGAPQITINNGQQGGQQQQGQQQFQEGQVYKDANGNQAKYSNGQWVPVQ